MSQRGTHSLIGRHLARNVHYFLFLLLLSVVFSSFFANERRDGKLFPRCPLIVYVRIDDSSSSLFISSSTNVFVFLSSSREEEDEKLKFIRRMDKKKSERNNLH